MPSKQCYDLADLIKEQLQLGLPAISSCVVSSQVILHATNGDMINLRAAQMIKMSPITVIVWPVGLLTCATLEHTGSSGFGDKMPDHVRQVLFKFMDDECTQAP